MSLAIAYAAAIGCSLCNGISTVQQKIGADHSLKVHNFDLLFLIKLFKNMPYLAGTLLEVIGYGLSLFALRVFPLFLVQSLIAASVLVTAFGERVFLHKALGMRTYQSLCIVVLGVILLSLSALSGHATMGSQLVRREVELLPIPILVIGAICIRIRGRISAFTLAALSGIAFGNTSTIGRILIYPDPLWKILLNPMVYSLILSAILGQYLFIVSLQRTTATRSNAIMIALQTLCPAFFGLLYFGDQIRPNFELLVVVGSILVILGSALTAVDEPPGATI
jgi:drug/metabolite transporter (DMT)-like permease